MILKLAIFMFCSYFICKYEYINMIYDKLNYSDHPQIEYTEGNKVKYPTIYRTTYCKIVYII